MILIGIGMLVAGVLLGAYLIYRTRHKRQAPAIPAPDAELQRALTPDVELQRQITEAFNEVNEILNSFPDFSNFPPRTGSRRTGSLFQTTVTTVTRTPASASDPVASEPLAQPIPPAPTPVALALDLFDHLAKEDESPNQ